MKRLVLLLVLKADVVTGDDEHEEWRDREGEDDRREVVRYRLLCLELVAIGYGFRV